jgi:hypothetical protein
VIIVPALLVGAGFLALAALSVASEPEIHTLKNELPDYTPPPTPPPPPTHPGAALPPNIPTKTGWKRVDAILDELKKAAASSGIPLGLLVGWIAKESGGKLTDTTSLDERGYFQLMPAESKSIGYDHQRLSTDSTYSINAGLALIGRYMPIVEAFGVTPRGTSYYWRLVKMVHTMGAGQTKKVIDAARATGQAATWAQLEASALANPPPKGPRPSKWFPFVDEIYRVGRPFGFGSEDAQSIVGEIFNDIPDPLDCLPSQQIVGGRRRA